MKNKVLKKFFPLLITLLLTLPYFVFANNSAQDNLLKLGQESKFQTEGDSANIFSLVGGAVRVFFSILGVIFIIILLLAGYHYMMAQGDEGKVKSSIASIRQAVIGLIILIGSYAIYALVWARLTK